VALRLQGDPETGDTLVVARLGESRVTLTAVTCRSPAARRPAPHASARAAIAHAAPLRVDAAVDRGGTRAQARAVVANATTADRRGFCFFANPAAR
jgi:hypothetical protein